MEEVPGELCIGLPARVLLETVERSTKPGELLLVGGLSVTPEKVPRFHGFAERFWDLFCEAQAARAAVQIDPAAHELLCAALLAGGGDPDSLPVGLSAALRRYESLPEEVHAACQTVLRPLIALSLECGRQGEFKAKLELVIESMAHVNSEDITQYLFEAQSPVEPDGTSSSSTSNRSV